MVSGSVIIAKPNTCHFPNKIGKIFFSFLLKIVFKSVQKLVTFEQICPEIPMKLAIFTDCFSVKFAPKFAMKLTVVSTNLLLKILGNLTFFC